MLKLLASVPIVSRVYVKAVWPYYQQWVQLTLNQADWPQYQHCIELTFKPFGSVPAVSTAHVKLSCLALQYLQLTLEQFGRNVSSEYSSVKLSWLASVPAPHRAYIKAVWPQCQQWVQLTSKLIILNRPADLELSAKAFVIVGKSCEEKVEFRLIV